jgi:hypothetical protein
LGIRVLLLFSILLVGTLTSSQFAFADGNDSPAECLNGPTDNTGNDPTIINAGFGNKVIKICIKDGNMAFDDPNNPGNLIQHSQPITVDGIYGANNCYDVSGIGTQTVTVDWICTNMAISHVDYMIDFNGKVGGHGGITSKTALLVTGATLNASWMIPLLVSAVGIGIFVVSYKNE